MAIEVEWQEYPSGSRTVGATQVYESGLGVQTYDFSPLYTMYGLDWPFPNDTRELDFHSDLDGKFNIRLWMGRSSDLTDGDLKVQFCRRTKDRVLWTDTTPVTDVPADLVGIFNIRIGASIPKAVMAHPEDDHFIIISYTMSQADSDAGKWLRMSMSDIPGYRKSSSWSSISHSPRVAIPNVPITLSPSNPTNLNFSAVEGVDNVAYANPIQIGTSSVSKSLLWKWTNTGTDTRYLKKPWLYHSDGYDLDRDNVHDVILKSLSGYYYRTPSSTSFGGLMASEYGGGADSLLRTTDYNQQYMDDRIWVMAPGETITTWLWTWLQVEAGPNAKPGKFPPDGGEMVITVAWDEW